MTAAVIVQLAQEGKFALNDSVSQHVSDVPNGEPFRCRDSRGVVSTADDLATWMEAPVGSRVLNAETQRLWLDSLQPENPSQPDGQKYGYGNVQISWGPNAVYFHGETVGHNSKISYDPANEG